MTKQQLQSYLKTIPEDCEIFIKFTTDENNTYFGEVTNVGFNEHHNVVVISSVEA